MAVQSKEKPGPSAPKRAYVQPTAQLKAQRLTIFTFCITVSDDTLTIILFVYTVKTE